MAAHDDYGLTPEQFHAGLDKLWAALDRLNVRSSPPEDVFTLCAKTMDELRRGQSKTRGLLEKRVRWLMAQHNHMGVPTEIQCFMLDKDG